MLNKLLAFAKEYEMLSPGDRVICAVSGGADSVALLFAMYLLAKKLDITVEAAHFNHRLRGEESDRDAAFVEDLCARYEIPLHKGSGDIHPGKKGLEAAARSARYAFFESLPGKIATAHTADDNAETVLMHLVRGTGLKGLGGITPVRGRLIRPMLGITRREVLDFLEEYHLSWQNDSTNDTDAFLRNRLRRHVIPFLKEENPRLSENLSEMALRLRADEAALCALSHGDLPTVTQLRQLPSALRHRRIAAYLEEIGVPEPEARHIGLVDRLIFSSKPSAAACLPGGVTVRRSYDCLEAGFAVAQLEKQPLQIPCEVELPGIAVRLTVRCAEEITNSKDRFTVCPKGQLYLRSRVAGDSMRLPGGTKELKKLFIDRKIPAAQRMAIPVIADDAGVLGVSNIGANVDRLAAALPAVEIRFEKM